MPTPSTTVHQARPWYSVPVPGGFVCYFRRPDLVSTAATALGVTKVTAANIVATKGFCRANAPRMPVAKKNLAAGSVSSIFDISKKAALAADGWSFRGRGIIRWRGPLAGNAYKSKTTYVTIGGLKYAWNMPLYLYNKIETDLAGLGVSLADGGDTKTLFWGLSAPKPARVSKLVEESGELTEYSTFCDPTKEDALPNGWKIVEPSLLIPEYLGAATTPQG